MLRALPTQSACDWRGALEAAPRGRTLSALAERGLAHCAWTFRPHRRLVARLTPAGLQALHALEPAEDAADRLLEARAFDALERRGDGVTLAELAALCAEAGSPASFVELNAALSRLERRVRIAGGRYYATGYVRPV
jgi:hypothetical protein